MTTDLDRLAEQIPLVTDRMLLETVNGITVARGMSNRHNGFFGRVVADLSGRRQRGTDAALAGLADGQSALLTWMGELSSRATVSNFALARALQHARLTTAALAQVRTHSGRLSEQVREVAALLSRTIEHFDRRITELEARLAQTEIQVSAARAFDSTVSSWAAGRRYSGLPWMCQVALIAREIAGGPCGELDYRTGQPIFSDRLANEILRHPGTREAMAGPTTVRQVVETGLVAVSHPDEALMLAELLDRGLHARLALPGRPLSTVLATALEFASLPNAARPERPADLALAVTRLRWGPVEGSTDPASFVTRLVREQADAADEYRATVLGAS